MLLRVLVVVCAATLRVALQEISGGTVAIAAGLIEQGAAAVAEAINSASRA